MCNFFNLCSTDVQIGWPLTRRWISPLKISCFASGTYFVILLGEKKNQNLIRLSNNSRFTWKIDSSRMNLHKQRKNFCHIIDIHFWRVCLRKHSIKIRSGYILRNGTYIVFFSNDFSSFWKYLSFSFQFEYLHSFMRTINVNLDLLVWNLITDKLNDG